MIITTGKVIKEFEDGVWIFTPRPESYVSDDVDVGWHDAREISSEQRSKAWSLIGEISAWAGYSYREMREVNDQMKQRFLMDTVDRMQRKVFSLSDCDMSTARAYISYLIDFCLAMDVPTKVPLIGFAEDLTQYVYACLIYKKCAVCGAKAELHHVDQIGMGYDRKTKPQLGAKVLPLCREHHTEFHTIGKAAFTDKYHLVPVALDERLMKIYGVRA